MRSPNRTWRMLLGTFAFLLTMYVAVVVLASCSFRTFLYPAPSDVGGNFAGELRTFNAKDGVAVHALHFRTKGTKAKRTLVHFHGNGETIRNMMGVASDLHAQGLDVMLVEYRGYGVSPGSPTEAGLYADAEAALDALAADGTGSDRIVLWGTSLGSGVATEMATRGRGKALVLVAPFTSIPRVADSHLPFLPMRLIIRDRYDNLEKAPKIRVPTLIIHGTDDEIVPYSMGKALAGEIAGAELLTIPGGHHNDVYSQAGIFLRIANHGG